MVEGLVVGVLVFVAGGIVRDVIRYRRGEWSPMRRALDELERGHAER